VEKFRSEILAYKAVGEASYQRKVNAQQLDSHTEIAQTP
jgi:hypothetical protein